MIETLAGVLTGAGLSWQISSWAFADPTKPTGHGAAFIAVNLEAFMSVPTFKERMDHLIREIHSSRKAEGVERIFVPGEIEFERRDKALVEGIDLPEDVVASLRGLAQDLDLNLEAALA